MNRQTVATILGFTIVGASIFLGYKEVVNQWILFACVALGAGMVFPERIGTLAQSIKGVLPWSKS